MMYLVGWKIALSRVSNGKQKKQHKTEHLYTEKCWKPALRYHDCFSMIYFKCSRQINRIRFSNSE